MWTSPRGARYRRAPLIDHPVASALWARQDTTSGPSSTFSVARTHASITVALTDTGHVDVAVRPAGEVAAASSSVRAMVGLDLHPWVGPHIAHHLAQRIDDDRTADTIADGNLTTTMQLLVRRTAKRDHQLDPRVVAVIMSIITPSGQDPAHTPDLSDRSIRRLVRSATGLTPTRLRRTARAATARGLLQTTAQSLADIAQIVGYNDQSHMTHDFRALCGYTPAQWQRHTTSWSSTSSPCLGQWHW
ncbi:MAG TPA: AraC family transcriptional regulator [Euzebya sp.]|nr:AraC family transcriptional regulator [Euzebya sp.]